MRIYGRLLPKNGKNDKIVLPVPEVWCTCRSIQSSYGFSIWDPLLISSCLHGDILTLYSEDFPIDKKIDDLEILNPFV